MTAKPRRLLMLAGVLFGLSAGTALARLAEPTVLFTRLPLDPPRRAHLFLTDLEGRNIRQFTDSDGQEYSPSWTPDGNVLHGEWNGLVLRDTAGAILDRIPLESVSSPGQPAWSPDGRRIAFSALPKAETYRQIFLMDVPTRSLRRLTNLKNGAEWPQWSPDGRWILFTGKEDLAFVDVNGIASRNLTATKERESYPALSPDGETVAYVGENELLYLLEIGTQKTKPITGFPDIPILGLAWTPDGQSLLFTSKEGETGRLSLVQRDGSGLRVLVEMAGFALYEPQLYAPALAVSPVGSKTLTWGALKRSDGVGE